VSNFFRFLPLSPIVVTVLSQISSEVRSVLIVQYYIFVFSLIKIVKLLISENKQVTKYLLVSSGSSLGQSPDIS
jgi:hypothetical protein